jgi:enoyl-CoA hydratase/carnithine racemase
MMDRITLTVEEGVAQVRLNRPDKMNALDSAMLDAIARTGETLHARSDVRAVVLSGEGRAFCAGLDLAAFEGGLPDLAPRAFGTSNLFQSSPRFTAPVSAPGCRSRLARTSGSPRLMQC